MAATRQKLEVWYDGDDLDGPGLVVVADQRDMAAFEAVYKIGFTAAMDKMTATFFRWIAWHALRRTGVITAAVEYEAWSATVPAADPLVDEEPADPTKPDPSGETS